MSWHDLRNTSQIISEKLPDEIYEDLICRTQSRRKDSDWNYNDRLVGALGQQSSLEWDYEIEQYLTRYAARLWNDIHQTCPWEFKECRDVSSFIKLRDLWVNFQRPGEYNPMHCHNGIASFVIFIDLPYGKEEKKDHRCNGSFQLENDVLEIDQSWNGIIIMFPSHVRHGVYPYKSTDRERVTVAGNLVWNVDGPGEEHY